MLSEKVQNIQKEIPYEPAINKELANYYQRWKENKFLTCGLRLVTRPTSSMILEAIGIRTFGFYILSIVWLFFSCVYSFHHLDNNEKAVESQKAETKINAIFFVAMTINTEH